MRKIWFWSVLLSLVLVACKKYEAPQGGEPHVPNQTYYDIGDYYRNDTLEGVVFLTYGASNGLLVSLEEVRLPWCEPNYVNSETGASNPYDGWFNTNILMSNYDIRHYPAIKWSHERNTRHMVYYHYYKINSGQWYVPSSTELSKLLQNQAAVNATLDSLGYPTLEDKTYWSSTETGTRGAAAVRMQDGQIIISDSVKDLVFYVRAIKNF